MAPYHRIEAKDFGEHTIEIWAGYATKLDTAPFTVYISDKKLRHRVLASSEAAARSMANHLWRLLKEGRRDIIRMCDEVVAP